MDILILVGFLIALVVVFKVMKDCLPFILFCAIAFGLSMVVGPIIGIVLAVVIMAVWKGKK